MSRSQTLFLHLANIAVCGTGSVYAWMRFLLEPADEWAVVNHPWQPTVQHMHVLAAPLLVFAVGLIWSAHVLEKLRNGHADRAAGMSLMVLFLPMVASGYLLQVAVDPEWRRAWIWAHVVSSLLWVGATVVHQILSVMKKTDEARNGVSEVPVVTPFRISASTGDESDDDSQRRRSNPSRAN